jgi:hypothetical protein
MKKYVESEHFNIGDKNSNEVAQIKFSSLKFFFNEN